MLFYRIFIQLYCSQSIYCSCNGKACWLCFESRSSFLFRAECRPWRSKGGVEVAQLFLATGARWGVVGERHAPATLPLAKRPGAHIRMPAQYYEIGYGPPGVRFLFSNAALTLQIHVCLANRRGSAEAKDFEKFHHSPTCRFLRWLIVGMNVMPEGVYVLYSAPSNHGNTIFVYSWTRKAALISRFILLQKLD
jgi:hypothetical protein